MEVRIPMVYSLRLERDEFLLISKALRCVLTSEEKEDALALQEKMLLDRHTQLVDMVSQSQKAVDNINQTKVGKTK